MIDLSQVKISSEEEKGNFGRFIIEPLDEGFGSTLGNSLRRVLLSSLGGAAITQVKIEGVKHQFQTLSGMSEDIIEFILNLKKIRLQITVDKPVKLSLDVRGPKKVTASDIKLPAGVSIINRDLVLANLADKKGKLFCQMTAEHGKGYVIAEERQLTEIGVIPIDSLFSPVSLVNYKIEGTRVGRASNFDRLVLEVKTDGTVKPREALKEAAKILVDHFQLFYKQPAATSAKKPKEETKKISDEFLKTTFEELDLPVRVVNALRAGKIETVEDYLKSPREKILKLKNLGPKSISAVEEILAEKGINPQEMQG